MVERGADPRTLGFDPIAEARRQWEERGWDQAAPGMEVVTSVMRVHQLVLAAVDEVLEPLGLTFARFEALALLSFTARGELPLGKLGARLQVHPTSVTNAVDRLEREGLVRRVPHPGDRRTTLARVTPKGRRLARRATEALNEQVFAALPLSGAELDRTAAALRRLRAATGDPDATGAPRTR
ncbi:MAG: MarR family transcriptional regulator [Acidimicrobiales bacterium]|jgi:DNA-binding MarR family transcriptional regulator|nr:MarR family transcriptional regulator [Acidimicrobiales bacterium]